VIVAGLVRNCTCLIPCRAGVRDVDGSHDAPNLVHAKMAGGAHRVERAAGPRLLFGSEGFEPDSFVVGGSMSKFVTALFLLSARFGRHMRTVEHRMVPAAP
jgi:hypothetical protein